MGHAPSTPGGHLVLIPDEEGFKVLLTNTIYPLRGAGDKVVKPRFKLKGKQSPPFEVRRVVSQQLSGCVPWSRCAPGGSLLLNVLLKAMVLTISRFFIGDSRSGVRRSLLVKMGSSKG